MNESIQDIKDEIGIDTCDNNTVENDDANYNADDHIKKMLVLIICKKNSVERSNQRTQKSR